MADQEMTNVDLTEATPSQPISEPSTPEDPNTSGEEEPEELQCEEVDMENEDMDPMEYGVRKVLPIPKKYFWDGANPEGENLSARTRAWHYGVSFLGRALYYAEFVGEVVAHALGLNESRYQYVIDGMSKEDWEKAKAVDEKRTREWEDHFASKKAAEEAGVTQNAI